MQLIVLGLNHKTAPVAVRECFSVSEEQTRSVLKHLQHCEDIHECLLLSTCNRTEVYAVVDEAGNALPVIKKIFSGNTTAEINMDDYLYYYQETKAIEHLFKVSSGLDSLVIGEGQILSQVKKAYSLARDLGTCKTILNILCNRAIAVGKKVRTQTKIAYNAVSVSYAAVELAKKVFGDLSKSNVLLLGAGQMSELTAQYLVANGVRTVFVSNRNYKRALVLADKFKGVAVPFQDFMESAVKADIVITSTGAPHYIVRAWDVAHLMPKRHGRPIIFIDIAVPRDIEPETAAIAGVSLYNIDDLEHAVEDNVLQRRQEAKEAEKIVYAEMAELVDKFKYLAYRPVLSRLRNKAETIRLREMKRALVKLPELNAEQIKILEGMSKMLVRKLLRDPVICINEAACLGKEEQYIKAVSDLFRLGEDEHETKDGYRHSYQ